MKRIIRILQWFNLWLNPYIFIRDFIWGFKKAYRETQLKKRKGPPAYK